MNGIDISHHQKGIDLATVPCDFVIIKATQGKSYNDPEFINNITKALQLGKYVGAYHYANGAGIEIEAQHFIDVVKPYLGKVILAIDWENNKDPKTGANDNPKFVAGDYYYCEKLLAAVERLAGVKPFLYMSKSVARQFKWENGRNYPFWCAQYANYNTRYDYVPNPWTDDKGWGPWNGCKIFQYSSRGRFGSYKSDLDLNLAYMDGEEWLRWAAGDILPEQPAEPENKRPVLKRGDRNEYVRSWQVFLNTNGYQCGPADGIFGQRTQDAVVKYQQDHGMEAGIIGELTWATLPF